MNKIHERFQRARVLLPVVHCLTSEQTKAQTAVAFENGADGVFLINQGGLDARSVVLVASWLATTGAPFVGVNLLGVPATSIRQWTKGLAAVWSDSAGEFAPPGLWERLFFGGVAFKYQAQPSDVGRAAKDAAGAGVDVVTTSGPGTGEPPTVEKVRAMRQALGDHALAVASGITPENVGPFLPFVDAFLVATGIEQRFGWFDPKRVRALADAIHGWRA